MTAFDRFHPLVNALYFLFAVVFGCLFLHPAAVMLAYAAALSYCFILYGRKKGTERLLLSIPAFMAAAVINPLFNHDGVTILGYWPSGNPLTAESIYYGACFAGVLIGVLMLCGMLRAVMTSDKMLYLTGRIFPTLSLILSVCLRFVPELIDRTKETAAAQKCIGRLPDKRLMTRMRFALGVFSVVLTGCLENAADTADSMRARGYGLAGRSAFSIFTVTKRDVGALIFLSFNAAVTIFGALSGAFSVTFFPSVKTAAFSPITLWYYAAYAALLFFPSLSELWEVIRWHCAKSET